MGSIELCCFRPNQDQEQDNHLARFLLSVHQLAVLHNIHHKVFPLPNTVVLNGRSIYLHHPHPYEHCLTNFTTKLTPKLYADSIEVLTCMRVKQQSVQSMVADIFEMKTVADRAWTMQNGGTKEEIKEYLLLNAHTVLTAVNQEVQIGNGVSLRRITGLIRFIFDEMCGEGNRQSEDYSLQMAVHTAECSQYAVGAAIYFTSFALFSNSNPQFPTLRAREQSVEMRVTDAKLAGRTNYFTFDGRLFVLPFALLRILSISQQDCRKCILLEWVTQQPLLDRILSNSAVQSSKSVVRQVVQTEMEESLKCLSDVGRELQKQMCEQYYRDYLENREENQQMIRWAIQTQRRDKLALKKEWELQEGERLLRSVDLRQIKLQSQSKQQSQQYPQMQAEQRYLPLRVVTPSEALQFGNELQAYIKDKDLLKMEKQLSRALDFTTMKTLNLSSCQLERIEHMQCLPNLEELYLYNNHICVIEGLETNYYLKLVSLTYNEIVVLEHLHELPELRRLYVSRNLLGADSAAYLVNSKLGVRELAISFTRQNAQAENILLENKWKSLETLVLVAPSTPKIQHKTIKQIIFIPW